MRTPQTSTDYGVGTKANGGRERSGAGDGVESGDLMRISLVQVAGPLIPESVFAGYGTVTRPQQSSMG